MWGTVVTDCAGSCFRLSHGVGHGCKHAMQAANSILALSTCTAHAHQTVWVCTQNSAGLYATMLLCMLMRPRLDGM